MGSIATEIVIIALLLLANGIFAMTEMALVSSRRERLRALAEAGRAGSHAAIELKENPNRFLSTVQIGITLIGILAGAFGGATLAKELADHVEHLPYVGGYAPQIAFGIVVVGITFFSLVIGELVPKRLALQRPEGISLLMARPMRVVSRLAAPAVHVLSASTEAVLRLLGVRESKEVPVTEEEVAGLVREGLKAGVFLKQETEMVESVLALDRATVRQIMTPRTRIEWISVSDTHDAIWHKIVGSHHTHFPVYENRIDNVIGFLSLKSIYANLAAGVPVHVRDLVTDALVVPESQSVIQLLETFQRERRHIALATDEFGGVSGVVTTNDLLEAIVGEVPEPDAAHSRTFVRRDDGSFLVDALVGVEELHDHLPAFSLDPDEEQRYSTLGGYVCARLGHLPNEGEAFEADGCRFEVVDMDRLRVDKVLVQALLPTGGDRASET